MHFEKFSFNNCGLVLITAHLQFTFNPIIRHFIVLGHTCILCTLFSTFLLQNFVLKFICFQQYCLSLRHHSMYKFLLILYSLWYLLKLMQDFFLSKNVKHIQMPSHKCRRKYLPLPYKVEYKSHLSIICVKISVLKSLIFFHLNFHNTHIAKSLKILFFSSGRFRWQSRDHNRIAPNFIKTDTFFK
jgi:hypothetical protein